jgi:hypothetical protein
MFPAAIAQHGHAVTTIRGYRESKRLVHYSSLHPQNATYRHALLKLRPPLQITLFFTVRHLVIGIGNTAKYEKDDKGYKTLHTAILFLYLAKVKWGVWVWVGNMISGLKCKHLKPPFIHFPNYQTHIRGC